MKRSRYLKFYRDKFNENDYTGKILNLISDVKQKCFEEENIPKFITGKIQQLKEYRTSHFEFIS